MSPVVALLELLDQIEIVINCLLIVSISVQPFEIEDNFGAQIVLTGYQISQFLLE